MPTLSPSRCQVSIPLEVTGQDSELCGSDSSFVCENCGPICQGCADTFPCPLTSDGKHTPIQAQTPTSDEALDAFYKLTHAMEYVAQVNSNPWDSKKYVQVAAILEPLARELARPFREAGIFKPEVPEPIIIKGHSGGPDGKWDEVQAIQHQPFIYVSYNGSEHVWAGCDDIAVLLEMLAHYRLTEHDRGSNCYTVDPCYGVENPKWDRWERESKEPRYIDGPRLYACDGVVRFSGNFERYSHAFGIDTNHKPTIDALLAAIAKNDQVVEDGGAWMAEQYRAAAARAEGGGQ